MSVKDELKTVGNDVLNAPIGFAHEMTEGTRAAFASFCSEIMGGRPVAPEDVAQDRYIDFFNEGQALDAATGKEHVLCPDGCEGQLLGKVELGGLELARVSQEDGTIGLTPWKEGMENLLGREVSIDREEGQTITQELKPAGMEREL